MASPRNRVAKTPSVPHYVIYPPQSVSNEPRSGVGRGVGLHFAEVYFPKAEQTLRIASGYFYLSGYNAARNLIKKPVEIQILAGKERDLIKAERGRGEITDAVGKEIGKEVSEVIAGFYNELGQTQTELYEAVRDLIQRIVDQKFVIKEARQFKRSHLFHCKFYVSDNTFMWSGSANFSGPGLTRTGNEEQVTATTDAAEIAMFID